MRTAAITFAGPMGREEEELYLNYRLNPRNPYPEWYTPCDKEEDARRWDLK